VDQHFETNKANIRRIDVEDITYFIKM